MPTNAPTSTPSPQLVIDKLARTGASDNTVGRDGLITYTILITNTGAGIANGVVVTDALPPELSYVAGSALPIPAQTNPMIWRIGTLAAGQGVVISFTARTTTTAAASIRNIAVVGDGRNSLIDQSDIVVLRSPTAITLQDFQAARQADGTHITWSTSLERNSLGFIVYRGTSPRFADAQAVNSAMVAARGNAGGARYALVDTTGSAASYYWLVEVELNGRVNVHGPIRVVETTLNANALPNKMFLPLIGSR
jgi:uncharacterized repeat protein (TIGR01451 family)